MPRPFPNPQAAPGASRRACLPALALAWGTLALVGCAAPSPTPEPTASPVPTGTATALPSETPTEEATATQSATATLEPTAVPTTAAAAATRPPAQPTALPPTAAPAAAAYDVKWWADKAQLTLEENCTAINWEVTGAKEVWLQWPHQAENQVEPKGRQDYVCIGEGERAIFKLRMVLPDGSHDLREMLIERQEEEE
jgi:hypothetical protein